VSVFDKEGVVEFCQGLVANNFEIVSTGGTAKRIADAGIAVTSVSDVTGFPEILGGRVKTLHPKIHGGLLATTDDHMKEIGELQIAPIEIVACNLYPFEQTIRKEGITEVECIEQIDIGGVTLLRAAAKNYRRVLVVSDPADYSRVVEAVSQEQAPDALRKELARKAFRHTATYDSAISRWFDDAGPEQLPEHYAVSLSRTQALRYGENPHQQGALYLEGENPFEQLQGKELSYNNILDVESAWAVNREFQEPCVAIIKHNIACGLAVGTDVLQAFDRALASDPVSAFGSIIAVNREVTEELLERVGKLFVEAFVAPSYSAAALARLAAKKKNCRVLVARGAALAPPGPVVRSVTGGLLLQTADAASSTDFKVVTKKQPTPEQEADLRFAWLAAKHVKSNAIVLVRDLATVGVGAGQPNRVNAVHLSVRQAGEKAAGSVLASDAFFPFADGLEAAAEAGVAAVIQPGGSIRDQDVIDAADRLGIAMVVTGQRHFRH